MATHASGHYPRLRNASATRPVPMLLEILASGVIGGLVGGALWALLLMTVYSANGAGFWTPMQAVAATFLGADALFSSGAILLGLALHFATSFVWGIFFATLVPRFSSWGFAMIGGLLAGVLVILPMTWGVLEAFDPIMYDHVRTFWGTWILAHLLFGAGLGTIPWLRRRLAEVPEPGYADAW